MVIAWLGAKTCGYLGVFGLLQLVAFSELVRSHLASKQFQVLLRSTVVLICLIGIGLGVLMTMKGWIAPWTGRFYSLWDTEYAKKYVSPWEIFPEFMH